MSFIATTITGLEKAAMLETKGKLHSPGRVIFEDYKKRDYLTIDTIYELLDSFSFKSLNGIIKKATNLRIKGTYKTLCLRKGEHNFNRTTAEQEVGKAIGEKLNLNYSKDNPDNIIVIDIINKNCNIGILKQKDLSKRVYRFKLHNQTTPQLLASCLIKYLKINQNDSLLVLESKDGVIPIEARLQGIANITAQDTFPNNIRNAKINAKLAKKEIRFTSTPVTHLKEKQDYIIVQIVFSKEKKGPYKLIHDIFKTSEKILNKNLAIITNHPEDIKTFQSKNIKLVEKIKVKHKEADYIVLIYKK